ncbi:hypothetical protein RHMOL_Rhmol01G0278300 [Rhododendron molle]|uniref:Uncharacterized protein n=1 Tax=Rhododendron molle TaxID=49168 RepID=A0ACC0Q6I4_RHOML|nr:hypothetical protein RHMOL_Rhmol01G0278300 [Rhododendron molle]
MEKQMGGDDTPTTPAHGDATTISSVHPDILQTHILTRLDGPTLASAACASSQLHALSTQETLWQQICHRTWPSTADPRVRRLISSFPSGHRSFYSDSFQYLDGHRRSRPSRRPPPAYIVSAVDIRYKNQLILSKVHVAETESDPSLPFRVDLLGPKEAAPMPVNLDIREDKCLSNLEENLTLSWILIDPTRTRAADVSTRRPVLVRRNWLANDVELRYATVLSGGGLVQCLVVVTCGGGGIGLAVGEVRLDVADMEGKKLGWKSLGAAVEGGRKRRGGKGEERERYEGWWREERERRRRKRRRENRRITVLFATPVFILLSVLVSLLVFVGIKFLQLVVSPFNGNGHRKCDFTFP